MRVLAWSELDAAAREQLLGRGVTAIFDPDLRESIQLIVEDVRENGDAAVIGRSGTAPTRTTSPTREVPS